MHTLHRARPGREGGTAEVAARGHRHVDPTTRDQARTLLVTMSVGLPVARFPCVDSGLSLSKRLFHIRTLHGRLQADTWATKQEHAPGRLLSPNMGQNPCRAGSAAATK